MEKGLENIEGISHEKADSILSRARGNMTADDVDALEVYISELRNSAGTDPLTGMKNRRGWNEDFIVELGSMYRGGNSVHSLLYFDLDHFKKVNDTYGHKAGDDVLRAVGKNVLSNVRASDTAYRIGGEEFLILFRDTTIDHAVQASLHLDRAISGQRILVADEEGIESFYQTKLSGGLIQVGPDHPSVDLYRKNKEIKDNTAAADCVLKESDGLLYHVKENGRNNIARRDGNGIVLLKN